MPGRTPGCQDFVLPSTYCEVFIHYLPFLLGHVLPMPYATYTSSKFFVHFFHLLFDLFGRDFFPSILVVILLFWGIFLAAFLVNLLVGLSLYCTFGVEDLCKFNFGVLHLLQFCGYLHNLLFFR